MKLILDSKDVEKLIKDSYNGVTEIEMPKDFMITLNISSDMFKKKEPIANNNVKTGAIVKPTGQTRTFKENMKPEEKLKLERSQGVMASGGGERVISRTF